MAHEYFQRVLLDKERVQILKPGPQINRRTGISNEYKGYLLVHSEIIGTLDCEVKDALLCPNGYLCVD